MSRHALIVGIDNYPNAPLSGAINDATAVAGLLKTNEDGSANFNVTLLKDVQKKAVLKGEIIKLFAAASDIALFYFAGHGGIDPFGYHIVTPDMIQHDLGVPMSQLLAIVNGSKAKNKIIILDCCHAGGIDETALMSKGISIYLCNGVTILTSSRASELSVESNGQGVFTSLLVEALKGGSADLNGNITPGSIYAFIDKVLGPHEQRPVFKTNISEFISLRNVKPPVPHEVMNNLGVFFPGREDVFALDPSFEDTNDPAIVHPTTLPYADAENVKKFKQLQQLQSVGLVTPVDRPYMYFAAMDSTGCKLTTLGKHYWKMMRHNNV